MQTSYEIKTEDLRRVQAEMEQYRRDRKKYNEGYHDAMDYCLAELEEVLRNARERDG